MKKTRPLKLSKDVWTKFWNVTGVILFGSNFSSLKDYIFIGIYLIHVLYLWTMLWELAMGWHFINKFFLEILSSDRLLRFVILPLCSLCIYWCGAVNVTVLPRRRLYGVTLAFPESWTFCQVSYWLLLVESQGDVYIIDT